MPPAPLPLSAQASRTPDSPISYFVAKALDTPGLISFAAGLVDEASLPAADVAAAAAAVLGDPAAARAALQYGSTQGYAPLRAKVLDLVCAADGVSPSDIGLTPADVVLGTGSQQLLYVIAEALLDPGDLVITEAPSYFVFHGALGSLGARVLTVPMDTPEGGSGGTDRGFTREGSGMNLDALEALLAKLEASGQLPRLKMIYTVDYFQNPSGLSLAADRRPRLVELAKRYSTRHRITILEDAAYRELRCDGPDLPSLKRFDPTNEFVAYTSTFSKPCAPGLKTGYGILPRDLVGPVCAIKGSHDFGSGNLAQHLLDHIVATGAYRRHVEQLRGVYRAKRDAMLRALAAEFADWPAVTWTRPTGGLYVWVTFPAGFDAGPNGPLVPRAMAEGVLYVPGEFCHVPDPAGGVSRNEARLCYATADAAQIAEGVRRLRRACCGLERG